jgi:hypothetical protein
MDMKKVLKAWVAENDEAVKLDASYSASFQPIKQELWKDLLGVEDEGDVDTNDEE